MSEVLLETPAEGVALLRINRPEARNALSLRVRDLLLQHFTALADDPAVRCIIITGNEKYFAAGADLRDMVDATLVEVMLRNNQVMWQTVAACPKPVIAAVNGFALGGGCELAMHADMIIAGEGASFGQPEVRVGIIPGAGGTQRLLRAVGKFKAMKIALTGLRVSAREADAMGLVTEVVPDDQVMARAMELAVEIAGLPPLAIRQIKEVMTLGADAPLATALALERKGYQLLYATEDKQEGMKAFFEKRKPQYKGR